MSYCDKCNINLIGGEPELAEHFAAHHVPGEEQVVTPESPETPPGQRGRIWKIGQSPAAQAEADRLEKEKADADAMASET